MSSGICLCCQTQISTPGNLSSFTEEKVSKFYELTQIQLAPPTSSFICATCDQIISEFYDYRRKVRRLHNLEIKVEASDVEETFKSSRKPVKVECNLEYEVANFESDDYECSPKNKTVQKSNFDCDKCHKSYKSSATLRKHMRTSHDENSPKPHKVLEQSLCSICAKIVKGGRSHLDNHMLQAHSEDFNFFCDLCAYKSKTRRNIAVHMKSHIRQEFREQFDCTMCPASFREKQRLDRHTFRKHVDIPKLFRCDCGKSFKSKTYLTHHYGQVHKMGHFPCENCPGRVFASKVKLNIHVSEFHAEKRPCEVCGKMIGGRRKMVNHMKTHVGPAYKCSFKNCTKEFFGNEALKDHIAIRHEGLKSFICPTCGSAFATVKTMRKHISRQHVAKKIPCKVSGCKHSAARKDYLAAHYKAHKDIDEEEKKLLIAGIKEIEGIGW